MANRVKHNMVNTRCTKCGARPWEKSRPCITLAEAKQRTRKPKVERFADEMPDNDVRFGTDDWRGR